MLDIIWPFPCEESYRLSVSRLVNMRVPYDLTVPSFNTIIVGVCPPNDMVKKCRRSGRPHREEEVAALRILYCGV